METEMKPGEHDGRPLLELWRGHIAAWRASGESQAEYCRRTGLKPYSFAYWKRRLSEREDEFVEVSLDTRSADEPLLEVRLGRSMRIEIRLNLKWEWST